MLLFSELAREVVGETGRLLDAAVEGLRSWVGSGWRLMEADWMVEAISTAGFDIVGGVELLLNWTGRSRSEYRGASLVWPQMSKSQTTRVE